MKMRFCVICKAIITGMSPKANYCSRKCYNVYLTEKYKTEVRAQIKEKGCEYCGNAFMPKTRRETKYCSQLCAFDARDERSRVVREPKECENCREVFTPTRTFQIYCGTKCRNAVTVLKRTLGMSAPEYHALQPGMTFTEKAQQTADSAHAEAVAKELEEQDLPLCSRCAVNKVRDPEAPYQQCESCIKITEAEEQRQ